MSTILAYFEHRDGQLKKTAAQVATAALDLASKIPGSRVVGLLVGNGVAPLAANASAYGIADIAVIDDGRFARFSHSGCAAAISAAAKAEKADIILIPSSVTGKDISPRVAVRLEAGYVPDCIALNVAD